VFGWSFYSQGTDRLTSSDEFFEVALKWFGDREEAPKSPWEKGERLAEVVRRERAILVLDGLEPLQWGPGEMVGRLKDQAVEALLKELGAQNEGLCLVTSRLGVADLDGLVGEKVQEHGLDKLDADAGAELLAARGVKGLPEELRAASEEYEGHSLSLTLLGSYLRKACEGDVRARDTIPRVGGKPEQRMMAKYEAWFQSKPELAILRLLGFFDRPVPKDEVAALLAQPVTVGLTEGLASLGKADWNEAVETLREVGLLARNEGDDERLDAHPLVREHFGEELRKAQPEAWKEGHRRLYEHLKGKAKEYPDTVEEMAPLYAAVVHGCLAGKSQEALRNVWWKRIDRGKGGFNSMRLGAIDSEIAVMSTFFEPPWERLAPGLREEDQAWVLNNAGFALRALGRLSEAMGLLRLGLNRRIAQQNWKGAAIIASNLSELLQTRGELREAETAARESVAYADKSGDAAQRMGSRTTLAAVLHAIGRLDEAECLFQEAEQMQKQQQPTSPLLYSLPGFRYCDLLLDQGRKADALHRAAQSLKVAVFFLGFLSSALDQLSRGRAHLIAARQKGSATDIEWSADCFDEAVSWLRRAGQQDYLPLGFLARADLHLHTGALPEARRDLADALTLSQRCGFRLHECDAHLGFARLALAETDREAAQHHLRKARGLIETTSYHRRDAALADLEAEAAEMARVRVTPSGETPAPAPTPEEGPVIMPEAPPYDIAIVCAVQIEFDEVLQTGKLPWGSFHRPGDPTTYYATTFEATAKGGSRSLRVVAACAPQMGMPASALIAAKMILHFQPALVGMVGIAAGVNQEKQGFGDVLVPETTFDYASGKMKVDGEGIKLEPDPKPLTIQANVAARIQDWKRARRELDSIKAAWRGTKPRTDLEIHFGALGSGPSVVDARRPVTEVMAHWRNLIGIEMEAHGVHLACHKVATKTPAFLAMKSICDFAVEKKDDMQPYAAFTAAQLFHRFVTAEWETLYPR
jgi:nucleoside phosphorylase